MNGWTSPDPDAGQAGKARTAFLRRQFGFHFLGFGFLWLVGVFEVVAVVHEHAWEVGVLVCVGEALVIYLLISGARAWVMLRAADPEAQRYDRDWLMQAVHENRLLAEHERPAAQETARQLLWNRRRRASLVFWPAVAIVLVVRNLLTRHHSDAGAAANVLVIVCAIFAQWGHVTQARLRRWMAANHL